MPLSKKHPSLLIDMTGASLLLAWFCAVLSMTVLRNDTVADDIKDLKRSIAQAKQQVAVLRTRLGRSCNQAQINRNTLSQRGKLPDIAPVEAYFQFLSERAETLGLRILNQYPTGERNYAGLRERRYAYTISGSLPRIVRFFKAVESSEYWADIGYLKIHPPRASQSDDMMAREAQLTVCLFSAESATEAEKDQG